MIVVLNTGCSNIGSILSMCSKLGIEAKASSNYKDIKLSDKIILPGVGHFDTGIRALKKLDLIESLKDKILNQKIPILGICLGMQLLCNYSEEGTEFGLGLLNADVLSFKKVINDQIKIPHMGWNNVTIKKNNPIFENSDTSPRFYFVHSYFVNCNDNNDILTTTNYGFEFTSSFNRNNIYGVQFHPEKSHKYGMSLLSNFNNIAC
jgi:glutamine amidotransferase